MAIRVELLANSSAWHAASSPTLRLGTVSDIQYPPCPLILRNRGSTCGARGPSCRAVSKARRARRSTTAGRRTSGRRRELKTEVTIERARSIVSHNDSPDVGFDQSINPYRGCEHGCIYCYARPSHAYLELSPGLDFETKLFAKTNAAELLARGARQAGLQAAADRARRQHRLLPADRAQVQDHAPDPRGAGRVRAPGDAWSPSRRWSSATSTCSGRWRRRTW